MKLSLLSRLFRRPRSRQEIELAYLSASVSLYDLECREREVAAGRFCAF